MKICEKLVSSVTFHVVDSQARCLLGKTTAEKIGLITFNIPDSVNSINSDNLGVMLSKYKSLFNGQGKLKGPTTWVSSLVVVPKASSDICLCLDMRFANTPCKKREISNIHSRRNFARLKLINGTAVFSTLNLKSGYYQLELDRKSRDITTFICQKGLFRYT